MNHLETCHPAPFTPAQRINHALTAALERRVLHWLARRVPHWCSPDHLTLLGLAAQCGAGLAFAASRLDRRTLILVLPCLALNWMGDSLDGTLARVRCQERPRFGFYVDHVVDLLGATALMGGLATSGMLHPVTATAMLTGFLLLAGESYLATYVLGRFELSQGLFGPTEIRLLLMAGTLALLHSPYATVFGHRLLLFDLGGAIASACMLFTLIQVIVRHTAQLYRKESLS